MISMLVSIHTLQRYLRVMESLVAACGVSGAPVNLTWRLWSIIIEVLFIIVLYLMYHAGCVSIYGDLFVLYLV